MAALVVLLFAGIAPSVVMGQAAFRRAGITIGQTGQTVAGATIAVCNQPANGVDSPLESGAIDVFRRRFAACPKASASGHAESQEPGKRQEGPSACFPNPSLNHPTLGQAQCGAYPARNFLERQCAGLLELGMFCKTPAELFCMNRVGRSAQAKA